MYPPHSRPVDVKQSTSDHALVTKVGRNQPCPCGSRQRYKRCCGAHTVPIHSALPASPLTRIERKLGEASALRHRREQQQGLGRPIISDTVSGIRVVAVGGRLYHSENWKTFHDFLRDYLLGSLGNEWLKTEQSKPVKTRHQILRWYAQAAEQAALLRSGDGAVISGPMTGAIRAFMNLAYNIYLIAHHGGGQAMANIYLRRLKSARTDDFTGALYETYAAAAFLKAGFELSYEELAHRSTSCVEFVARWPATDESFSVEVKASVSDPELMASRNQKLAGKPLRVGAKLVKALSKKAEHRRVVFIEVNRPQLLVQDDRLEGWAAEAIAQIRGNEAAKTLEGSLFPPAYVFVTNHSFHHYLTGLDSGVQLVADGFRIDDFGPEVRYRGFAGVLAARERHSAMMALIASLRTHYEIPATFAGEMPGSLNGPQGHSPLIIGKRYLIPGANGDEVVGRLESATVSTSEKLAYGVYRLNDGTGVIATCPLTSEELADYNRYPETFFGAITPAPRKAKTFIEKCDFLFETYQHSTRESLLEFMAAAADIEELRKLSQRDLAVTFCERMAQSMQDDEERRRTSRERDP